MKKLGVIFTLIISAFNIHSSIAQNLEEQIRIEIDKYNGENFYAKKALECLENKDYYNLSAKLANLKADSTLIYKSLRKALATKHVFTCQSLLNTEYLEHTKKWGTPLYSLDTEKYIQFCDFCRKTLDVPYDPGKGEENNRPFELKFENVSLYELSIIIRERDQLIRQLKNKDQMIDIDQENFMAIEFILSKIQDITNKDQLREIISNIQIAMHHQPDVKIRNRYKDHIINCECIDLQFVNGAFQYRTDKISSGMYNKEK